MVVVIMVLRNIIVVLELQRELHLSVVSVPPPVLLFCVTGVTQRKEKRNKQRPFSQPKTTAFLKFLFIIILLICLV